MSSTQFLNFKHVRYWSEIQEINSVIENFWKKMSFDIELNWFKRIERALPRAQGFFSLRLLFIEVKVIIFVLLFIAFLVYCEKCWIVLK